MSDDWLFGFVAGLLPWRVVLALLAGFLILAAAVWLGL